MQLCKRLGAALAVLGMAILMTSATPAADKDKIPWDKTLNGHEMWMTSLDEALAASSKEGKHVLIDLYSLG